MSLTARMSEGRTLRAEGPACEKEEEEEDIYLNQLRE